MINILVPRMFGSASEILRIGGDIWKVQLPHQRLHPTSRPPPPTGNHKIERIRWDEMIQCKNMKLGDYLHHPIGWFWRIEGTAGCFRRSWAPPHWRWSMPVGRRWPKSLSGRAPSTGRSKACPSLRCYRKLFKVTSTPQVPSPTSQQTNSATLSGSDLEVGVGLGDDACGWEWKWRVGRWERWWRSSFLVAEWEKHSWCVRKKKQRRRGL